MSDEAILADLVHCDSELHSLVDSVMSILQSHQMESILHYFVCFDAYMQSKDDIDSVQIAFPSLTGITESGFSTNQDTRDHLLDDLYCLLTFLQERARESSTSQHSLTMGCSQEIAGFHARHV